MRFTKTKIAVAVATTAVVALGSTAAYAYFTTGGSGTGSATAGVAVPLTATITVAGPALVPDGSAHELSFSIHNPASFAQHASSAVISVGTIVAADGTATLLNTLCDFSVVQPTIPSGGFTFTAGQTIAVPASAATGALVMTDNNTNQSACEGATVSLTAVIS
ncbi:MAG TPA: hypothetical protein VHU88_19090 [Sporichthyaceae bacterium]|jgi:Zn-dependent M28 family amino/carboxypeptidase|nr:hypothetical protein [Sporichthyaceae bacterium]